MKSTLTTLMGLGLAVLVAACASPIAAVPAAATAPTAGAQAPAPTTPGQVAAPTQAGPAQPAIATVMAGATPASVTPEPKPTIVQPAELPSKGASTAPVLLVEFSDFQ